MKKPTRIIASILCLIILFSSFSINVFAAFFENNITKIFDSSFEGIKNNVQDDWDDLGDESIYDAFDVPEPPLWHTIIFFLPSLFVFLLVNFVFPGALF